MKKTIGAVLREARISSGKSIAEVSAYLVGKGFKAAEKTIYSWENDNSQPTPTPLLAMCTLYGIDDVLSAFGYSDTPAIKEQREISAENGGLTEDGRRIGLAYEKAPQPVKKIVDVTLEPFTPKALEPRLEVHVAEEDEFCDVVYFEQMASAGTGVYLDDARPTTIRVRRSALPSDFKRWYDKYFAVTVQGDSMEPKFRDGDIILVSRDYVTEGKFGLFTLNGEGYVKQLRGRKLHSLNKKYADIPLEECAIGNGKVIGVLQPEDIEE